MTAWEIVGYLAVLAMIGILILTGHGRRSRRRAQRRIFGRTMPVSYKGDSEPWPAVDIRRRERRRSR